MGLKNWLCRRMGKKLAKDLNLQEGPVGETKKWYQSKAMWAGIIAVILGLYDSVGTNIGAQLGWHLPVIPDWVFAILGGLGVYGRSTADKKIG